MVHQTRSVSFVLNSVDQDKVESRTESGVGCETGVRLAAVLTGRGFIKMLREDTQGKKSLSFGHCPKVALTPPPLILDIHEVTSILDIHEIKHPPFSPKIYPIYRQKKCLKTFGTWSTLPHLSQPDCPKKNTLKHRVGYN